MSIEAARTGYLYVVDQELYADGSKGEPYLIFPTTRTRGGDNSVKVGRVIEIPAQEDAPFYFTLKRTRTDHVGEVVSVLVSPTPIQELTITDKAQRLASDTRSLCGKNHRARRPAAWRWPTARARPGQSRKKKPEQTLLGH
jgi:hypothetical protein